MMTRIISSVVAIALAVFILFFHNTVVINLAIAVLTVGILAELFKAENCFEYRPTVTISFVFAAIYPMINYDVFYDFRMTFVLCCVLAIFLSFIFQHKTLTFDKLCFMLVTSTLTTLSMNSLLTILRLDDYYGIFYLVLTLCGAWVADSGAYFAGTLFGKHKLCPNISPKKTVEGLIGGVVTNALIFVAMAVVYGKYIAPNISFDLFWVSILGVCCALLGLVGDLSASLIKRQCHIKDYGNIMPGHGGVLDRFDSLLFVAPFMAFALTHLRLFVV